MPVRERHQCCTWCYPSEKTQLYMLFIESGNSFPLNTHMGRVWNYTKHDFYGTLKNCRELPSDVMLHRLPLLFWFIFGLISLYFGFSQLSSSQQTSTQPISVTSWYRIHTSAVGVTGSRVKRDQTSVKLLWKRCRILYPDTLWDFLLGLCLVSLYANVLHKSFFSLLDRTNLLLYVFPVNKSIFLRWALKLTLHEMQPVGVWNLESLANLSLWFIFCGKPFFQIKSRLPSSSSERRWISRL